MIYLDHAATTPTSPAVVRAMCDAFELVGNPSSLHGPGRIARRLVEEARESIAADLGAHPSEIIFTSGGTEADNLAVTGFFRARRRADPRHRRILCPPTEHHAVLDTVDALVREESAVAGELAVDADGRVSAAALKAGLAAGDAALVSVMWANNEVGTVNPIAELAALGRRHGVPFHTDAVQALGQIPLDFGASGADAMTVTAHKVGGPVGTGALLLRRDAVIDPILHGGGQERGVRSGTLNVAGIAGFALAVHTAVGDLPLTAPRMAALRDALVAGVVAAAPEARLSGDPGAGSVAGGPSRLPGNVNLRFPGCDGDSLLLLLDAAGIACSTGSACTAGVARPSHVLLAMGVAEDEARGALRFSLGPTTTRADIDAVIAAIGPVVRRARGAAAGRRGAA